MARVIGDCEPAPPMLFPLAQAAELSYCRRMAEKNPNSSVNWRTVAVATGIGALVSAAVALVESPWLSTIVLGTLLSFLAALVWQTLAKLRTNQSSLLETPFYLAHDAEIFDRYRRLAQEMLRISGRSGQVFRACALESLDASIEQISVLGDGKIVFQDTETWRLIYEKLLRDPSVTVYRSVALVRNPQYWQDGAGTQSMQLNFALLSQSIITIERTVIVADDLWPADSDLPTEAVRQWIHEQSVHGIWTRLVRESALRSEADLLHDMGIYGFSAVGFQELDDDGLRTSRFTLDFDFPSVREAEKRWNRLNVYASSYRDLLDQFRLTE